MTHAYCSSRGDRIRPGVFHVRTPSGPGGRSVETPTLDIIPLPEVFFRRSPVLNVPAGPATDPGESRVHFPYSPIFKSTAAGTLRRLNYRRSEPSFFPASCKERASMIVRGHIPRFLKIISEESCPERFTSGCIPVPKSPASSALHRTLCRYVLQITRRFAEYHGSNDTAPSNGVFSDPGPCCRSGPGSHRIVASMSHDPCPADGDDLFSARGPVTVQSPVN
jgi:hypothetical protein